MRSSTRRILLAVVAAALAAVVMGPRSWAEKPKVDEAALERTRTTVKMLDDLHKGYVVNITATYVEGQDKAPAAKVMKKVFKHMEEKGWGSGRLIDATGEPANAANKPKSDFEKAAVEQMKKGKTYYEEVATREGKPVLRAATIVPVVMKQCSGCHLGKKEGELLGAIVYELPIK
ncbi:MAG TPA: DUF3365 domain-containing protein [Gemmataceae bacterium]|nr:DUF3365 domain-containing protein [Gemmataceae bacterium]